MVARERGALHLADAESVRNGNRTLCGPILLETLSRRTLTTYDVAQELMWSGGGCFKCRRSPRFINPKQRSPLPNDRRDK